jgi:hypothetical protein
VLPGTIAMNGGNISSLRLRLSHTSFRISHRRTRDAAAKLLIHFYNKNSGKHSALRTLTGYSKGGLGKLMMIMRKKGMITSKGYQQWAPSDYALKIMKEAHLGS